MASRDPEIDDIRALALRGVRPGDIAERLGLSRQRVYMRISWLRRVGEEIPEFPRGPLQRDGQRQFRVRGIEADLLERLAPHAEARGLSAAVLAGRLLNVIARDGLTDAILDDTGDRQ